MNPSAIYSKSGKGVQEASGKTSLLKRADRAVLSAIDGRANVSEVAKKVGKPFDAAFQALIAQLDRDGFVREVSAGGGAAAGSAARPAAKPAAARPAPKPAAPAPAVGEDLDFTGIMPSPLKAKPAAPAAKAAAAPADPAFDPSTTQRLQEAALYKAREEAEARAQEQRDRLRAEAEAKARSEAEAKARADAEKRVREETAAKVRAEAEAKAKAVREAAVKAAQEAKAKFEAEAKAKVEAERLKAEAERRAREEAERKAREEAEKARREAEELRLRLEEERKAREEAERKAREEAERRAREEAERKAREEAERKAREEAELKAREEAERKAREEAERKAQEEAERKAQEEAQRKAQEEAQRKARAEAEAQMRRAREEAERKRAEAERKEAAERERRETETRKVEAIPAPAAPPAAAAGGGGLDELMADLDSFTQRDEDDRKAREEAESRAREERKRKLAEESEQRAREQAERERHEVEARRQRQEEERRAREDEERRAREEEERVRQEAQERARQAREALAAKDAQAGSDDIGVTEDDLGMDDVRRDEAAVAKESRKARREREREAKRLEKEARERDRAAAKAAAKASAQPEALDVRPVRVRRRRNWGRPAAITLFLILAAGIGVLHVMPVGTEDYERAAAEALRQPVRVGSARLSLFTGLQLNLTDVSIGSSTKIASMRAYPEISSLFGREKRFNRLELDGVALRQDALGESLSARARGPNFAVERIIVKDLKLEGPLPVPLLEADVRLGDDGAVRTVLLRGPEGLMGQLTPKADGVDFDVTAGSFTLPFAPDVSLGSFAMKGRAGRQGMRIEAWGGSVLGGAVSGTANLRWGGTWQLDGVLTVRGINAAVFAPALLSEGNAEGTGKFSMSGAEPAKLVRAGRVEGSFTIGKGVLGSFDLARAIRTDGREVNGRTQFVELNGQGTWDRGAVALRNVIIGAGALQAGASADISQSGALSGRIVADVRTPSQSLRAILQLGGTVKEPQVRN